MKNFFIFVLVMTLSGSAGAQWSIYAQYDGYPGNDNSLDSVGQGRHQNLARCLCDQNIEDGETYSYYFEVKYTGPYESDDVTVYIGNDCGNVSVSLNDCMEVGVWNENAFSSDNVPIEVPINYLVDPEDGICTEKTGSSTFYVFSDLDGRQVAYSVSIAYDTKPPSAPTDIVVKPGENALTVNWDNSLATDESVLFYNVLCMREGSPSEASDESKANWVSTQEVCGKVLTTNTAKTNWKDDCPDGAVTEGGAPSKCFVCGSVAGTSNSVRIDGLENDAVYSVAVVAVDDHLNVSDISEVVDGTPVPTTDFAEHYRESGGEANGDYCFIATAVFGDLEHPFVQVLRRFRDKNLMTSSVGRAFVKFYYKNGPRWAASIGSNPVLLFIVKVLLVPVVLLAAVTVVIPPWLLFILFTGGLYWYVSRKKRLAVCP